MRKNRFFLLPILALGLGVLLGGPVSSALAGDKPREVVIGFQVIPNAEIVAKDLKWQEKSLGVPVRWVQMDSGRDLNTAMASGSVDIGLAGSAGVAAGIAQGIPYEAVFIHDIIGQNEALVVVKDGPVESVKDLKGKTVAAPFGATTHYHLLAALELAGVDPKDLRILDLQPPELLAAWIRGDIDAGFVWEPTLAKMLEHGGRVLMYSGELAQQGYLTGDICVVRKAFAEKYPEIVAAYLKNLDQGVGLYKAHPKMAAASVARQFGIPEEEALRQMRSLILLTGAEELGDRFVGSSEKKGNLAKVLKSTADFLESQRLITRSPALSVFADAVNPSYLEKMVNQKP